MRSKFLRTFLVVAAILSGPLTALTHPVHAQAPGAALNDIKARKELRVGWAVFYPYIYLDPQTKKISGFAADFMEAMSTSLGVKLVWVEDSWATLTAGLQTNKFDMTLPGVAITLPRAEVVTFSKPVAKMPLGLLVRKADAENLKSWKDLDQSGKRITTTLGSVVDLFASKRFEKAEIVRVKAGPDSIAQLMANKADAWANGIEGLAMIQKEHPELAVVPGEFGVNPICIALRQGDLVTRDYVNLFIDDLRRTGVLKAMVEKYGLYAWSETADADQ
jgi:polar amino acid transport system substrate-binding protein